MSDLSVLVHFVRKFFGFEVASKRRACPLLGLEGDSVGPPLRLMEEQTTPPNAKPQMTLRIPNPVYIQNGKETKIKPIRNGKGQKSVGWGWTHLGMPSD